MRHIEVLSIILILLASSDRAQAASRLLFVPPLLVDDGASWQDAQKAVLRVQEALGGMAEYNVVARDGPRVAGGNREALANAQTLLKAGEKAYLAFDHARAAEMLERAAELLAPIVESLDSADMRILTRARFLEGTAWAESHHPDQAIDAFTALLDIVPDQDMDDSLLPPKVQPLWRTAVDRLYAQDAVRVTVRADPVAADVSLDGRWRGRAPLTLNALPQGKHRLSVSAPGYLTATEQIDVETSSLTRNFSLKRTSDADPWVAVTKAAAGAPDPIWLAKLAALEKHYDVETVVMVALKRASNGDTWMVLERWQGSVRAGIVVLTAPSKRLDVVPDAIEELFAHSASPVYMPRPKAPPLDFETTIFGVPSDAAFELPAAEASLIVWGTVGSGVVSDFGPALGLGLGGTVPIDDAWSFDLIAEVTRSTGSGDAQADEILGRLMVRRGFRWRSMATSIGLHIGTAGLFVSGNAGAGSSYSDVVPDAGVLARFDFDIGDWFLISVMGLAQADALGLGNGKGLGDLTYEATFHGMLGLGGRF